MEAIFFHKSDLTPDPAMINCIYNTTIMNQNYILAYYLLSFI